MSREIEVFTIIRYKIRQYNIEAVERDLKYMNSIPSSLTGISGSYGVHPSASAAPKEVSQESKNVPASDSVSISSAPSKEKAAVKSASPEAAPEVKAAENDLADRKVEPVKITIISTNDLHGAYKHMPQVAGLVETLREKHPGAILIDGGDSTYNPPYSKQHHYDPMVDIMNEMNYNIVNLGNHEFQYGRKAMFTEFVDRMESEILCANVFDPETGGYLPGVQPYVIEEVEGVKVAFAGVLEPKMHTKANPHVGKDVDKISTAEGMQRIMPELEAKADIIIAMTHQGLNDDRKMVNQVDGIDMIFGAHDHAITDEAIVLGKYPNQTYLVESGSHCKLVGLTEIFVDPQSKEIIDIQFRQYPVQTSSVKPDPEVSKIISDYNKNGKPFISGRGEE